MRASLACVGLSLVLFAVACEDDPPAGICVVSNDCPDGQLCVSGACMAPPEDAGTSTADAGSEDAGADLGAADSGVDAGSVDTGTDLGTDAGLADTGVDLGADAGSADRDGDGVLDVDDNCPDDANPGQEDTDLDGMGDACDPPQTFTTGGLTVPTCGYTPPIGQFSPASEWHWVPGSTTPLPNKDQVMSTPVVINLTDDDGDGDVDDQDVPDVVFISFDTTGPAGTPTSHQLQAGVVRAVSGDTGRELWSASSAALQVAPASNLAAADLDGDGVPEILAERWSGGVLALRANGSLYWDCNTSECRPVTSYWGGLAVADLDGGGPEVLRGGCVLEGTTGAVRFCGSAGHGSNGVGGISVAADLDGDGRLEVVAGRTAYRSNGTIYWNRTDLEDGFVAIGQLDSDSNPEIALVARGSLYVLEHDGSTKWRVAIQGGGQGGPPTIANFDADTAVEIGVAGQTRYGVYELNGSVTFSSPIQEASSSRTGSSVFDFDGDGQAAIVYNDETTLRVYSSNGSTTPSIVWSTPNSTFTAQEYPVIADVDADGNAEIIVGANDFGRTGGQRGLYVYGDVRDNWVPTRTIWNQHSYHVSNISAAGTVPYPESNSWTASNTYRTNEQGGSVMPLAAPDLRVRDAAFAAACPSSVEIGVWLENRGANQVAPGLPVGFYAGNPSASNPSFALGLTTQTLRPGDAEWIRVRWSAPQSPPSTLVIVADDDGTGQGTGTENECDESNNQLVVRNVGCP